MTWMYFQTIGMIRKKKLRNFLLRIFLCYFLLTLSVFQPYGIDNFEVSFADFPRDMEQGEIYTPTPRKVESPHFVSWTPKSSNWGTPCTPSMLLGSPLSHSMLADSPMTPSNLAGSPPFGRSRALQSVGEIPSTPSIDHIYFQNQEEVKTNFYSQPNKAPYTKPTHIVTSTQLKPRANLLYPHALHKHSDVNTFTIYYRSFPFNQCKPEDNGLLKWIFTFPGPLTWIERIKGRLMPGTEISQKCVFWYDYSLLYEGGYSINQL